MIEFDQRFSSSFVALILKVNNPMSLNDFDHISLLGELVARVVEGSLGETGLGYTNIIFKG